NIGTTGVLVVARTGDFCIHPQHRRRFHHIQSLPFRRAFRLWNVYKNNITKLFCRSDKSCSGTGETGADYRYFLSFHLYTSFVNKVNYIFLMSSSPNSEHFTSLALSMSLAKSYVTTWEAIVFSIAFVTRSAASCQPMCSSISTPERTTDEGFTLSSPAYFGAVPCVASKIA